MPVRSKVESSGSRRTACLQSGTAAAVSCERAQSAHAAGRAQNLLQSTAGVCASVTPTPTTGRVGDGSRYLPMLWYRRQNSRARPVR
jgi:hypothetical protein